MSDYYATLKIQNGPLIRAMKNMGYKNGMQLAKAAGLHPTLVYQLLNFKQSPKTKWKYKKVWRPAVLKICDVLAYSPEELFPSRIHHEIPTNQIADFVEQAQLGGGGMALLGPGDHLMQEELADAVKEVLATLKPREQEVLQLRIWEGKTLDETGKSLSPPIEKERVRQIEAKALRRLRHPYSLRKLEGHLDDLLGEAGGL